MTTIEIAMTVAITEIVGQLAPNKTKNPTVLNRTAVPKIAPMKIGANGVTNTVFPVSRGFKATSMPLYRKTRARKIPMYSIFFSFFNVQNRKSFLQQAFYHKKPQKSSI